VHAVSDATNFYLYFADEATADSAASQLREREYEVTVRPGADDENWLALATRVIADDHLDEAEEELVELAESLGGEFDGFDRP
jgi:Regulator of ribonuclease activity B